MAHARPSIARASWLLWAQTPVSIAPPLASWNDGPAKEAIARFVTEVSAEGAPTFVAPRERIAVFDNDGTLWPEQPVHFQAMFVLDRIRTMAPQHPEWQGAEPFKSILAGDTKIAPAGGEKAVTELIAATHAGMTTEEFEAQVTDWFATARHPRFRRPVHRPGLPADGGATRISAHERLQDVHRVGRRHRVHAAVDRKGVRNSARPGDRQPGQARVRDARGRAGAREAAADRSR